MADDIGESVRDRLQNTAEVSALVLTQIYADILPAEAKEPAIVVQVPQNTPHEDINGSNRIYQSQVLVLAYGRTRKEANQIAKAIRDNALAADLRGRIEGMEWQECSLTSGPDEAIAEPPQDGSDKWRRVTAQTFTIWNSPV